MPRTAKPPLSDPRADAWYRSMARKSRITADVNYRRLRAFCEQMGVEPAQLLQRAHRQTDLRDLLGRFVDQEVAKRRASWYIHSTVVAVKSWLAYNDRPLRLKVDIPSNLVSARREEERPPTVEELHSVMLAARPHERVVAALMAFSGLRPGAIGSYLGDDGLRLKDLPELHYPRDGCRTPKPELHIINRALFEATPTKIRVRAASSKARHQYLTFLGEEGCGYVAQYLEERMAGGETLTPDSDLAHPQYAEKRFVRSLNVGARVRRVFKKVGLVDSTGRSPRPYVLRQYFLSRCLEAQARASIPDRFVEFWAGHRGDVTAQYYTTGLPNLPGSMVEEMRAAYKRCEPFLSSSGAAARSANSEERFKRLLLKVAGFTDVELAKVDWNRVTDGEIEEMVANRVGRSEAPVQRVVSVDRVESLLATGWEYVAALAPDRVVLRVPNGSSARLGLDPASD